MNEQEQVNEGYVIIESVTVGNARFVIGENPNNQAAPYVTWQANVKNDPNNFSGVTTARPNLMLLQTLPNASTQKPNICGSAQRPT